MKRRREIRLLAAALTLAALLAGTATVTAAPNPGAIYLSHGNPPANLRLYAHRTGMAVLDFDQVNEIGSRIRRLRRGGAEFFPYVDLMEAPIGGRSDWEERARLYAGKRGSYRGESEVPRSWWWRDADGKRRSNYPGSWMMNIAPGSAYSRHAVRWAAGFMRRCLCDGLYLDVLGSRLYSPAWDRMSNAERRRWSHGAYALMRRLRARLDPDGNGRPILVANNSQAAGASAWSGWPNGGNRSLNGFVWEQHPRADTRFFEQQAQEPGWQSPRRMMVIARNYPSDCSFWQRQRRVDSIFCTTADTTGYDAIEPPQTPFHPRRDHIQGWSYPGRSENAGRRR